MPSPDIFYFGGYASIQDQVDDWAKSVTDQLGDKVGHVFARPYPNHASSTNPLALWKQSTVVAASMLADRTNIIVGHSSGCAIANDVAKEALRLNKPFRLVCLEGFLPPTVLLLHDGTTVWSAQSKNGTKARNFAPLCHVPCFKVYEADVSEEWPLHFSVVNVNVSDDYPHIYQGYHDCKANIVVLGIV